MSELVLQILHKVSMTLRSSAAAAADSSTKKRSNKSKSESLLRYYLDCFSLLLRGLATGGVLSSFSPTSWHNALSLLRESNLHYLLSSRHCLTIFKEVMLSNSNTQLVIKDEVKGLLQDISKLQTDHQSISLGATSTTSSFSVSSSSVAEAKKKLQIGLTATVLDISKANQASWQGGQDGDHLSVANCVLDWIQLDASILLAAGSTSTTLLAQAVELVGKNTAHIERSQLLHMLLSKVSAAVRKTIGEKSLQSFELTDELTVTIGTLLSWVSEVTDSNADVVTSTIDLTKGIALANQGNTKVSPILSSGIPVLRRPNQLCISENPSLVRRVGSRSALECLNC